MGLLDSLLGKDAKAINNPTNFQTLPDFGQDMLRDVAQQGTNIANQSGYFTPLPMRSRTTSALTQLENGIQSGQAGFDFGQRASAGYGGAASALDAAGQYINQIPQYVNEAGQRIGIGSAPITGTEIASGINDFMNPYSGAVVNNTMRDINRMGDGLFSNMRAALSDAGATGSSREGIYAGEIARNMMEAMGNQSAQLYQTGFNSAANNALTRLQGDRNNMLQGAGLNLNQAATMNNAGNSMNSLAANMTNYANSLANSRSMADTWRSNDVTAKVDNLNRQISAGQMFNDQALAQRNVPMQQLSYLQSILNSSVLPTMGGGTITQKPGSEGLLNRIAKPAGSFAAGFMGG